MASLTFIDTNVFAYAYDSSAEAKRERAVEVLSTIEHGVVSTQVLMELYSVLTRKLHITPSQAREAIAEIGGLRVVPIDRYLVLRALELAGAYQISHWDALIVLAAATSGCDVVLTEDLRSGAVLEGVRVHNPFD